ncbi:MAG: hypothetical protein OEV37_00180 [Candidatus Berkelbacteria bacterium]|nr:hypothetical protein [Candidatus Berkelbacteria bacterium]
MKALDKVLSVGGKIAGVVALSSIYGPVAHAQITQGPIEGISLYGGSLGELIDIIIQVVLWGAGAIAFAYLIYGGISYITAGGDAEKAGKGRTAILNAVIGIIVVSAALAIYKFVLQGVAGDL